MMKTASSCLARWSFAGVALFGLVACGTAPVGNDAAVPPALVPDTPTRVLETVAAAGVQIYECRGTPGAAAPGWALVAPDAELFDMPGQSVGAHGEGPSWTAHDGSRVVGSLRARVDAPAAVAIPWLLLSARSTGAVGRFSQVTHIQRLHTEGGLAPAGGCDAGSQGQRVRVRYRANYRLLAAS